MYDIIGNGPSDVSAELLKTIRILNRIWAVDKEGFYADATGRHFEHGMVVDDGLAASMVMGDVDLPPMAESLGDQIGDRQEIVPHEVDL